MKRDYFYIAIIAVALVFYYIEQRKNASDLDAIQKDLLIQKEDRRKVFHQFEVILKQKDDSLQLAKDAIKTINAEKQQVETLLARKTKSHEKIVFVNYSSDSARISAIKKLYPSFR